MLTIGGITVQCEMTGHTKPDTRGPTHVAVIGSHTEGNIAVVRWPTRMGN